MSAIVQMSFDELKMRDRYPRRLFGHGGERRTRLGPVTGKRSGARRHPSASDAVTPWSRVDETSTAPSIGPVPLQSLFDPTPREATPVTGRARSS
jgi:hypothetical protein